MRDDAHPTKRKLLAPELRRDIVLLKEQMDEFAGYLTDVCNNLEVTDDAIFKAQEIAKCLLDDDLSAWDAIEKPTR